MKIIAIVIATESDPKEVQDWLDANPNVIIAHVSTHDNLVYIFYD